MLRWWDFYLKNINTGVTQDPDFRVYMMDSYKPGSFPDEISGRWVQEPSGATARSIPAPGT